MYVATSQVVTGKKIEVILETSRFVWIYLCKFYDEFAKKKKKKNIFVVIHVCQRPKGM